MGTIGGIPVAVPFNQQQQVMNNQPVKSNNPVASMAAASLKNITVLAESQVVQRTQKSVPRVYQQRALPPRSYSPSPMIVQQQPKFVNGNIRPIIR